MHSGQLKLVYWCIDNTFLFQLIEDTIATVSRDMAANRVLNESNDDSTSESDDMPLKRKKCKTIYKMRMCICCMYLVVSLHL